MESRLRASPEQFVVLLKFMESHGDITRPQQGPHGRIKADRLWLELEELLNSTCGGVIKSMDKWKKVWADWKAKTKKKALTKRGEAPGTGGGPSSRPTLTALEERVLGIMGLTAVIGKARIQERGFAALPSERVSPAPTSNTKQIEHIDCHSQISDPDETQATSSASTASSPSRWHSVVPPSGELSRHTPLPTPSPPPGTASAQIPSATSPPASTSRRHDASSSPAASPTTSTSRRRGRFQARTRRIQTPFQRVMSELVAIKNRQLQLEADREKNLHEREMERLRLESKRIEMVEKQNVILNRLAGTVDKLIEILPQLRSSSLQTTDIIP